MAIFTHPQKVTASVDFSPTKTDAFNRLRVSNPLTLFDSIHRYSKNDLWVESTTGTATSTFNGDEGVVNMVLGSASGDTLIRETTKVFAYQPGKSLLIMNTFTMGTAKTNLRQRVGYFGAENGLYAELDNSTFYFVKRSSVTGSLVNTRVAQSSWSEDKLDGVGPSGVTLDISKVQLMWMDLEWLGAGTVRMGFVVDGVFIHCHSFHHSNLATTTYISTASLPLRYEITNTGSTSGGSTLKQISSSIISEGGYELHGRQQAVGTPINSPYTLGNAGTLRPVVSLRLKAARRDAIAVLTAASVVGVDSGTYTWQIVAGGTSTGGTWVSAGSNSSIDYKITGTGFSGGRILASGYFSSTNQSAPGINLLKEALFKFQFERNTLAGTSDEITLVMSANGNAKDVYCALDWEEVTR